MTGTLVILSMLKCCELVTNYFPFFLVMPSAACYNLLILLSAFSACTTNTHFALHAREVRGCVSFYFKKKPRNIHPKQYPS